MTTDSRNDDHRELRDDRRASVHAPIPTDYQAVLFSVVGWPGPGGWFGLAPTPAACARSGWSGRHPCVVRGRPPRRGSGDWSCMFPLVDDMTGGSRRRPDTAQQRAFPGGEKWTRTLRC